MYNLLITIANIKFKLRKISVHNIHSTPNLNSVTVPMCHVFSGQRLPSLGAQPDGGLKLLSPTTNTPRDGHPGTSIPTKIP